MLGPVNESLVVEAGEVVITLLAILICVSEAAVAVVVVAIDVEFDGVADDADDVADV